MLSRRRRDAETTGEETMKTDYKTKCRCCNGSGKMLDYVKIGLVVRDKRELAGLTLSAIAKRAGWSTTFQSYVERGLRPLSDEQLRTIREVLG